MYISCKLRILFIRFGGGGRRCGDILLSIFFLVCFQFHFTSQWKFLYWKASKVWDFLCFWDGPIKWFISKQKKKTWTWQAPPTNQYDFTRGTYMNEFDQINCNCIMDEWKPPISSNIGISVGGKWWGTHLGVEIMLSQWGEATCTQEV